MPLDCAQKNRCAVSVLVLCATVIAVALARALLLLLVMVPSAAAEEPSGLMLPTAAYFAGNAADWTASAWCQHNWRCEEGDPMYRWAYLRGGTPPTIALMAGVDIATYVTARHFLGHSHPKLFAGLLYASAGYRSYLAARNIAEGRRDRYLSRPPRF